MYRSIAVPLDRSPFGESALPLATALARRAGAELQLVHVHQPGDAPVPGSAPRNGATEQAERDYLDDVTRRLTAIPGLKVTPLLLPGPVTEALEAHALTGGVDLIVMATHGRGPFSRFWLGSVADRLMRLSPVPILLVCPSKKDPCGEDEPRVRRILIPLDGSHLAERILTPTLELGRLTGAEYTLLRIVRPGPVIGYDWAGYVTGGTDLAAQHALEEEARDYLERVAERWRPSAGVVHTWVESNPCVGTTILHEARARSIDLIALTSQGHSGWRRLLLGSVTDTVLHDACLPVLVWHPAEQAQAKEAVAELNLATG